MNSVKTFEDFKQILKIYELKTFSKFNVYYCDKGFLDEKCKYCTVFQVHY